MSRIILSVETSSTICSTAIIENGEILSCVEEFCPREHIEKLPGFVKKAFDKSNKTVSNIDAIACKYWSWFFYWSENRFGV